MSVWLHFGFSYLIYFFFLIFLFCSYVLLGLKGRFADVIS